jgi:AcrR family transcriptional regulator
MAANVQNDQTSVATMAQFPDITAWARARVGACRDERRDAAENRRLILATARALFTARGVEAVSMVEIARAAAVGQGTLYRRFPHKGALCQALLEDSISAFHDEVMSRLAARAASEPALELLVWMLGRMLEYIEANSALLSEAGKGERGNDRFHDPWYAWLHETVAVLLAQAVANGEATPLDEECVADALLVSCNPDLYHFQRCERGFARERIAASLRQIVMGLSRDRPSAVAGVAAEVAAASI